MSELHAMFQYAQAFEMAYLSDDFSILRPFFSDSVVHVVTDGGPFDRNDVGREAVVDGFRIAVHEHDRRFDVRIPEILEGPTAREEGVWMRFRLTTRRTGLPDLVVEGDHLVRYEDGKIAAIEEKILGDGGARATRYFAEHDARLGSSSVAGPVDVNLALAGDDLSRSMIKTIVRAYGAAKSQQDIDASLVMCHDDFSIETVPFGIRSRDRAETEEHLALFFEAFPDYRVEVEGLVVEGDEACLWGRARMSLQGSGLGVAPTGKTAELPVFCMFQTRDNLLTHERFVFDLADLCRQLDVSIDAVNDALALARDAA